MVKKVEKSGERDMGFALTTLFQAFIVQLMDVKVLTVEQADQVFDGAVKRAKKAADAPDAVRLIQQVMTRWIGTPSIDYRRPGAEKSVRPTLARHGGNQG